MHPPVTTLLRQYYCPARKRGCAELSRPRALTAFQASAGTGSPPARRSSDGVVAYVCCTLEAEHETGDHFFVVGRVDELALLREQAEPLAFLRGAFIDISVMEAVG